VSGCWRPSGMNGSEASRSSSANHAETSLNMNRRCVPCRWSASDQLITGHHGVSSRYSWC
jgi:hypothetical protein